MMFRQCPVRYQPPVSPPRQTPPRHPGFQPLPHALRRLDRICRGRAHPLPCAMTYIGDGRSDRGQPMALYACPLCDYREAWVKDRHSGKPRKLFHQPGKRRA